MSEEERNEEKKSSVKWTIVCYNVLGLVGYTLLLRFVDGGIFFDAFILVAHVITCIICAIAMKSWEWVLSAFLVLAIGFSTCVTFLTMSNMH